MRAAHAGPTDDNINKRPRLSLSVKNFGPVEHADISLKPLTILLGPNNCGKSHIAKLVHSVISCESRTGTHRFLPYNPPRETMQKIMDIAKRVDDGQTARSDIAKDLMKAYVSGFVLDVLCNNLSVKEWKDIIRYGSKSCHIDIQSGVINAQVSGTAKSPSVEATAPTVCINPKLKIPYSSDDTLQLDDENDELIYSTPPDRLSYVERPEALMGMLAALFEYNSMQKTFRSSFYIPSDRAGVLDMYKSIIPGILDSTSSYRDHTQSTMSEFIAQLLFLEDKRGVFADTVDDMSQDITDGRINVERHQMGHVKDIYHEYNGYRTSAQAASSSIKALTPILLQLKYNITLRDLLILEEPETNLDLENQTRLAECVARLVNQGLCMVVTTHSTYFIDKLSNCLRAGILHAAGHDYSTIEKGKAISRDDLAVYQFSRPGGTKGYKTVPVEMTEYSGIDASEFIKTDDTLYEELLSLDQQANSDTGNE